MTRTRSIIFLIAAAAAFIYGTVHLFQLRFEVGDVYPAYSSLRSDPLGTMALYESVGALPGFTTQRDLSPLNRLPETPDTVYLHLATSIDAWQSIDGKVFAEIQKFLASGNRLVVTFHPQAVQPPAFLSQVKPAEPETEKNTPKEPTSRERWGMDLRIANLERGPERAYQPAQVRNVSGLLLPDVLEWHSGIVFTSLDPSWRTIYTRPAGAVVIERSFGSGVVVMATDSYFLSNEALARDRHADLLAWIIGSGRNVVFDEAHLGVTETPGVATLLRRYKLQWVIAGILLLAGLFVWKNIVSLVPPKRTESSSDFVHGRDAAAGFVNLLRRSISAGDLLATCFREWEKSGATAGGYSAARIASAKAVFDSENSQNARNRDPVRAYQSISKTLQKRIQ